MMPAALRYALRAAFGLLLIATLLFVLAGCGGGDADDDDPPVPTPKVDCAAHPEQCK